MVAGHGVLTVSWLVLRFWTVFDRADAISTMSGRFRHGNLKPGDQWTGRHTHGNRPHSAGKAATEARGMYVATDAWNLWSCPGNLRSRRVPLQVGDNQATAPSGPNPSR